MRLYGLSDDQNKVTINLKAVEQKFKNKDDCKPCYFYDKGLCDRMYCTPHERKDKRSIYWKEVTK